MGIPGILGWAPIPLASSEALSRSIWVESATATVDSTHDTKWSTDTGYRQRTSVTGTGTQAPDVCLDSPDP